MLTVVYGGTALQKAAYGLSVLCLAAIAAALLRPLAFLNKNAYNTHI